MVEVEPGHRLVGGHPVELVEERDHVGEVAPLVAVHVLEVTVEVRIGRWQGCARDRDRQLRSVGRGHGIARPRGRDPDCPALGRRVDLCAAILQPLHDDLVRVAVGVERAGLDHGDRGIDGRDERRPRRGAAPVVADFEDPRRDGPAGGEHPALGRGPGIAGKQERLPAEDEAEHDRGLVLVRSRDRRRVQDGHGHVGRVEREGLAGGRGVGGDRVGGEVGAEVDGRLRRGRDAIRDERPDRHRRQDAGHPADVVGVVVGGDDVLEPRDPFGGKSGRDGRRGPGLSCIDEHRPAVRRLDEEGVALADVEEGDGQGVGGVRRCGASDGNCEEKDRKQQPHYIIPGLVIVAAGRKGFL